MLKNKFKNVFTNKKKIKTIIRFVNTIIETIKPISSALSTVAAFTCIAVVNVIAETMLYYGKSKIKLYSFKLKIK